MQSAPVVAGSWQPPDPVQGDLGYAGTGAALNAASVNSMPIIGPAFESANDRAVAWIKSKYNGTPFADELAKQQAQTQGMLNQGAAQQPTATTARNIAGPMIGLAPAWRWPLAHLAWERAVLQPA